MIAKEITFLSLHSKIDIHDLQKLKSNSGRETYTNILILLLIVLAWVGIPGALIGWIAGFWNWQVFAGIIWGVAIILTYPGLWRRRFRRVGTFTYFLALAQAAIGWTIVFVVGNVTH